MMDFHRKEQLLQIIEDNKDDTLPLNPDKGSQNNWASQ